MNNILEIILDLIQEMGLDRKSLERLITNHAAQIVENLYIISRFEDPDYVHHLTELDRHFKSLSKKSVNYNAKLSHCY